MYMLVPICRPDPICKLGPSLQTGRLICRLDGLICKLDACRRPICRSDAIQGRPFTRVLEHATNPTPPNHFKRGSRNPKGRLRNPKGRSRARMLYPRSRTRPVCKLGHPVCRLGPVCKLGPTYTSRLVGAPTAIAFVLHTSTIVP